MPVVVDHAWRQIGKNPLPRKDDYLTGAVTTAPPEDPKFKTWKSENSMVMSWLINFITNEIGEDFTFYETAKEIWDATKTTYLDKENTSELFEVKGILDNLKREELRVTQHFNALNRCWQHLDLFDENKLGCPECCQNIRKLLRRRASSSSCSNSIKNRMKFEDESSEQNLFLTSERRVLRQEGKKKGRKLCFID
ncbi:hypothetical protein CK203_051705 [Vitis vinifera]|uniref:Retrotransposon Copia-like N-terminal domain-containing protein n=1 Tax=Vitis vinifera TaxID=29760 RepID=A0A438H4Y5_VITVI|nr:hypothetical protein CK203_051705 [Vitis vinifera]